MVLIAAALAISLALLPGSGTDNSPARVANFCGFWPQEPAGLFRPKARPCGCTHCFQASLLGPGHLGGVISFEFILYSLSPQFREAAIGDTGVKHGPGSNSRAPPRPFPCQPVFFHSGLKLHGLLIIALGFIVVLLGLGNMLLPHNQVRCHAGGKFTDYLTHIDPIAEVNVDLAHLGNSQINISLAILFPGRRTGRLWPRATSELFPQKTTDFFFLPASLKLLAAVPNSLGQVAN